MTAPVHECDDPAICPPCQDANRRPLHGWPPDCDEWSGPILAKYPGRCGGCDFPIGKGQTIRRREVDGEPEYRHEGACVEDVR